MLLLPSLVAAVAVAAKDSKTNFVMVIKSILRTRPLSPISHCSVHSLFCLFRRSASDHANVTLQVLADDQGWGDVGYNTHQYQDAAYNYTWK